MEKIVHEFPPTTYAIEIMQGAGSRIKAVTLAQKVKAGDNIRLDCLWCKVTRVGPTDLNHPEVPGTTHYMEVVAPYVPPAFMSKPQKLEV
jgi:hypothetical protein